MKHAFTLIELLVVVTIIVVLLALLTPALDQALYQATLAVDGANLSAIAVGANVYATAQQRKYPHRYALNATGQPQQLNDPWTGGGTPANTDDRLRYIDYFPLDVFLDPLCDEIDIDPAVTVGDGLLRGNPYVFSSYFLFYGFQYVDTPGQRGLKKLGDRFTWASKAEGNVFGKQFEGSFDVLACDQNALTTQYGGFMSSHPDMDKGLLKPETFQNEQASSGTLGLGLDGGFYLVLSRWIVGGTSERRGTLDLNSARTDGGVVRMNDVAWDEEGRVTSAPTANDGPGSYNYWLNIPR